MKAFISVCTILLLVQLIQGCPWMHHKFGQYSRKYLTLLEKMGEEITENRVGIHFPEEQYRLARRSQQPERITRFIAQVLDEVSLLMDEDLKAVAWDKKKLEEFMSTLNTQLEETESCVSNTKMNKKLHLYFKKLRKETLGKLEDKAQAWELIRKEVHRHLTKIDLLASTHL